MKSSPRWCRGIRFGGRKYRAGAQRCREDRTCLGRESAQANSIVNCAGRSYPLCLLVFEVREPGRIPGPMERKGVRLKPRSREELSALMESNFSANLVLLNP